MANDTPHGLKSNRIWLIVIIDYEKMPREKKKTYYEEPMPFVAGSIESLSTPMHPPFLDPKLCRL